MKRKRDFRDWKELPSEQLHLISKKLIDIIHIVRFRTVCKSWRCSASLADAPPQFPWLLEVTELHYDSVVLQEKFRFHALSSSTTGTIRTKQFPNPNYFTGPSCGSLLVHDTCTGVISPINPLTNSESSLQAFRGETNPWPVWTGKDPMCNRDMIVVDQLLGSSGYWMVSFGGHIRLIDGNCCSFCYLRRMLFISSAGGVTLVMNAVTKTELYQIDLAEGEEESPWVWPQIYVVESAGVVLRVSRSGSDQEPTFCIYQLDFGQRESNPTWVKVTSIGDQMLFLDVSNGFSMSAASFLEYQGNCIYFLSSSRKPCRYDIANGTVEWLLCPFERCTWYLPCLQ